MGVASAMWELLTPLPGVRLVAEPDAVWLRVTGGMHVALSERFKAAPKTRLARLLPVVIPQLLEMGLAVDDGGDIKIAHADFTALEDLGIDAFRDVVPVSP